MKTCRKDFQGRKSTTVLKLLCRNIAAGRFNWRRYCTPQTYFGQEICVTPLHCSYGQIGYTVHFPYSNMPEVEYDWEMGKLTVDEENWKEYFRHSELLYEGDPKVKDFKGSSFFVWITPDGHNERMNA